MESFRESLGRLLTAIGLVIVTILVVIGRGISAFIDWFGQINWGRIKPGWYVLIAGAIYAIIVTIQLGSARRSLVALQSKPPVVREVTLPTQNSGLRWPIIGATLPKSDDNLPNAPRTYRQGVSQGFVLTGIDAGVPVVYGMPVVAAGDGQITRADGDFKDQTVAQFNQLLTKVRAGAGESDLDKLRGRQVWIAHSNNTITRYGHLSRVAPFIRVGTMVKQGQIIGYVGNSGTLDGARGNENNARLQFEIWEGNRFLGQGLTPAQVRTSGNEKIKVWP